jgi:hypothetical protein
MKNFLALFLLALGASYFATRAMADAVVVSPNGIGMHHHGHDRHHGDEGMHHMKGHGGHDVDDHSHHADRGHEKPAPNKMG